MNYEPLHWHYETNRLFKKTGAINFLVKYDQFERDPVDYLSCYGDLYSGYLRPDVFIKLFHQEKPRYLHELSQVDRILDNAQLQPAAFKTMLCREALNFKWAWPAIVNQTPSNRYDFYTGMGRLLATGLTKSNPWQHLKILLFANKGIDSSDFLEDFVVVKTFQQLATALNLSSDNTAEEAVELEISHDGAGPGGFRLTGLSDGNTGFHFAAGDESLNSFRKWYGVYGVSNPKLYIYTEWPDLISDSRACWDIKFMGPSQFKHGNFHLGHLEYSLREHNANPLHGTDHVLHITKQIPMDVSDLLTWVDLEHTAWIDQQYQFVLFRHNSPYKMMFVSKSYV